MSVIVVLCSRDSIREKAIMIAKLGEETMLYEKYNSAEDNNFVETFIKSEQALLRV